MFCCARQGMDVIGKEVPKPIKKPDFFDSPPVKYINGMVCLRIEVDPLYPFQTSTQELNELGLPNKEFYTTSNFFARLMSSPFGTIPIAKFV